VLQLRPGCECCDRDLPADSPDAMICSFECIRPGDRLVRYPASTDRVFKPGGYRHVV
jgi:uncharacterized protein